MKTFDRLLGLPPDAEAVWGKTAAEITTNTAVAVLAPSATNKALFISKVIANNKTIAEDAIITLQDNTGTPIVIARAMVSTAGGNGGNWEVNFNPPVQLAVGKSLMGIAPATTGDTHIFAQGWEGSPVE